MRTDHAYQEHYERGKVAGEEALRLMSDTELADMRERLARIANELESDSYDAAYARGFLRVTVKPPVPPVRWKWKSDPTLRRALRRRTRSSP